MKPTPTLLAASSLLALLNPVAAHAEEGILTFELSTPQWAGLAETAAIAPGTAEGDHSNQPLPIPARAANPPMRFHSPQQLPAGVYRRGVAVALNEETSAAQLLPPAPPLPAVPVVVATTTPLAASAPKARPDTTPAELDFALEPSQAVVIARAKLARPKATNPLPSLFEGNSDSLVAWAVGSAEGTRTPNGAINPAYFGHTDPGNRVWNMGTFSYQHGAKTPEEADRKQLARLQTQGEVLRQRALEQGLNLTLEETLNGLDLANQSPLAAIGRVGYIERLAEAKQNGLEGSEAILVARTRAYINPRTGRWNAPGLGNTEASIRRDQKRRADAVARAIAAYVAQNSELQPQTWTLAPAPEADTLVALDDTPAEPIDNILKMWTSPSDPIAPLAPAEDSTLALEPPPRAPDDPAPLAELWQVTVDRFVQAAMPQGASGSPQTASLVTVLFNRGSTPVSLPPSPGIAPAPSSPAAAAGRPETRPTPATSPENLSSEPEAQAVEPLAIAPPTWAETREGYQTTPPARVEAPPVPGAFPDSNVYRPHRPAAPALGTQADAIAQPDPYLPRAESPSAVSTAAPAAAPLSPQHHQPNPIADPGHALPSSSAQALPTSAPAKDITAPEHQPLQSNQPLEFDQVKTDGRAFKLSPLGVATQEEEAIATPIAAPEPLVTPQPPAEAAP